MTDECVTPYFARVCPLVCNCFPTYPSHPLPSLPLITEPFKFFFFFPILFVSFRLLTHITKKKQSNIKIETKTNEQFTEGWWNKKMKRIRRDVVAAVVVHSLIPSFTSEWIPSFERTGDFILVGPVQMTRPIIERRKIFETRLIFMIFYYH